MVEPVVTNTVGITRRVKIAKIGEKVSQEEGAAGWKPQPRKEDEKCGVIWQRPARKDVRHQPLCVHLP